MDQLSNYMNFFRTEDYLKLEAEMKTLSSEQQAYILGHIDQMKKDFCLKTQLIHCGSTSLGAFIGLVFVDMLVGNISVKHILAAFVIAILCGVIKFNFDALLKKEHYKAIKPLLGEKCQ